MTGARSDRQAGPTGTRAWLRDRRWLLAGAAVAFAVRLTMALTHPVIATPDTPRYRNLADVWRPFQVWRPDAGPGVVSQAVFLLPERLAVCVQIAVSAALWTVLALLLWRGRRGRLLGTLTIIWSLTPWSTVWDSLLLTEAIALPATVLALTASVLAVPGHPARTPWLAAVAGASIAVLTRPVLALLVLPVMGLCLLAGCLRGASRKLVRLSAVSLCLVLAFGAWQTIQFEQTPGNNMSSLRAQDRLIGRGSHPGYLPLAARLGMPSCPDVVRAVTVTKDRRVIRSSRCPGYQQWLAQGGVPWHEEILRNPGPTLAAALNPVYWVTYPLEATANKANVQWWGIYHLIPGAWKPVTRGINAAIYAAIGISILAALRRRRRMQLAFAILTFVILAGWSAGMWLSDGIEYWRHVLPALYALAPVAWALWQTARSPAPPAAGGQDDARLLAGATGRGELANS